MQICLHCGEKLGEDYIICPSCGRSLGRKIKPAKFPKGFAIAIRFGIPALFLILLLLSVLSDAIHTD